MASPQRWEVKLLEPGRCEPLKAAVHGVMFATVAICAAYNTAAWLRRRQRHLAVNAVIYTAALFWERRLVAHHLAACASRQQPGAIRVCSELVRVPAPQDLSDAA